MSENERWTSMNSQKAKTKPEKSNIVLGFKPERMSNARTITGRPVRIWENIDRYEKVIRKEEIQIL